MIYFSDSSCISPQHTFGEIDFENCLPSHNNWLQVVEPNYPSIPRGVLRRMGKAVRFGVGASLDMLAKHQNLTGIILGTANGGMEDCIKFLNQIIEFDEGTLTPTNFVQSTTNAIAGQIGMMSKNTGYNATHVHRGLAFENALLDAVFLCAENKSDLFLVGGIDEISTYNYSLDLQAGWYKSHEIRSDALYASNTEGSIAGEGAAFFTVGAKPKDAQMKLTHLKTLHTADIVQVEKELIKIGKKYQIDTIVSGENGDSRQRKYYNLLDLVNASNIPIFRYKHLCGEYPTSTAFALWMCFQGIKGGLMPSILNCKIGDVKKVPERILIYNNYHGQQHSFMVVEKAYG